ncbi:secreted RxLR effector peptide protein, putative [Phytophthora infestans T30-4]|uniref:Secreted RxLR effector peptide protein, putative n=2 Tax=Phytophthora infestans TaxID=4787 RepID=D0NR80_PHYIT|nr:secreted RxLR effector peptide protein, putative [Phytophthora infestans T30-4]EEY63202.1 secreted RxLR effector peptide protein, putative [Phytophthora infestans T30-4]KAF4042855.1 hypothetical protein GN244_ATG04771 [Phytophthora infestans]|eukprot:XP_002898379.1 secreted RxLR effector peptide protein, putative [Phytophthora infestans T30-4]
MNRLVLLAVAFVYLLMYADATRESKLKELMDDPTREFQNNLARRNLRADRSDEDEERVNIPGFNKIAQVFKSSKTKELQGLLKADDSLANAFKTLGLSKMPIGKDNFIETDMVAKLFSSPNFKIWARHAANVNKQDPESAMLAALTNVFGEKEVATMILVGKLRWRSKSIAQKLETAQLSKWYSKGLAADDVFRQILSADPSRIKGYGRYKGIWENYSYYFIKRVVNY